MSNVARARLRSQLLVDGAATPADAVRTLGALQAQDDGSVLWSIGLRTAHGDLAAVQRAFEQAQIVRTWLLRGTLHVCAAEDVRWLLGLVAPKLFTMRQQRREALQLDAKSLARSGKALQRALEKHKRLTRDEAMQAFEAGGVSPEGQRGYHILSHLALEGLVCFGPNQGNQHTVVLLDDWVPAQPPLGNEEAAVRLAQRYFAGRAPSGRADFGWWSGLPAALVKTGMAALSMPEPAPVTAASAHLLPGFDEYLLGYKERAAVLDAAHANKVVPGGNGVFLPTLLVNGQVLGTWKRTVSKSKVRISFAPFEPLSDRAHKALAAAAKRYGKFVGLPVELS